MDDGRIIDRCLSGEREAFEMIVNKYQAGVRSLAWGVLGNREEAEDAAQDAFLRAYTNLPSFDHSRSFKSWLYAIAYNRCLDRIKKARTERKYRPSLAKGEWRVRDGSEDERMFDASAAIGRHWRRLGAKERLALTLAAKEGCAAAEIAGILRCSESSARVHIFNAKRKLRKWLKGDSHV